MGGSVGETKEEEEEEGSVVLANNPEETGGDGSKEDGDDSGGSCEIDGCGGRVANCCIVEARCGIDCCSDDNDDGTDEPSGEWW